MKFCYDVCTRALQLACGSPDAYPYSVWPLLSNCVQPLPRYESLPQGVGVPRDAPCGGLLHAADSKPIARVISLLEIETDDPSGYAKLMTDYNQAAKAKLGIDNYVRIYESVVDGRRERSRAAVVSTRQ